MIDSRQTQAWVNRHVPNPADRSQIARGLQRLRNQEQVRECQGYILLLLSGQRCKASVMLFLRAAQRLGLQNPQGGLLGITPAQVLVWANTARYPTPMPRAHEPWPKPHQGRWEDVTRDLRAEHQAVLVRFFRHTYTLAGLSPSDAEAKARALMAPAHALQPLPPPTRQTRPDARSEDWTKLLRALEERRFDVEPLRDMWRFVLRVLIDQGNRAPLLLRAPLSNLKIDADATPVVARIEKIRGPGNKPNPTLRLGAEASAAAAVWAQTHPFRERADAPLLISPKAAAQGTCKPLASGGIYSFLAKLGRQAELAFPMGTRAFRYYGHNEAATAGHSDHQMGLKFGRTTNSDVNRRYVHFAEWRVIELMRRIRALHGNERRCSGCRRLLEADQPACTSSGCPRAGQPPATNNTELLADLGITLHHHEASSART